MAYISSMHSSVIGFTSSSGESGVMQYLKTVFTYQNQSDLALVVNDRYMQTSATFLSIILYGVAEM